ncbi:rust resistance kinase Lr10-like [Gossypium raimondii]|uniref:rust resistance kinase Lr10-like n=1 Tax=Gossypium raimondii TaxID=29730 RepID=UPI00227CEDD9|nr:rust resistance kinase Lr10-like [Gossypium raimondii]
MPKLKAKLPLLGHLMPAFALFVILFPAVCFARRLINQDCGSTFCGNLNISFPFRLKNQPPQCGHYGFEFECENNNRTILVDKEGKFSVQQIFYENYTIRMVDASLDTDDCNSLPLTSVYYYYYTYDYELSSFYLSSSNNNNYYYNKYYYDGRLEISIIYVMNCTKPIKSSLYIEASRCTIKYNISSSLPTSHFYFLNGNTHSSDINQACTIEAEVPIMTDNIIGMSTLNIYKKLLEGFWVEWDRCNYQSCYNKVWFKRLLNEVKIGLRRYRKSFEHFIFHGPYRPGASEMYKTIYDHSVEATVGVISSRSLPAIIFLLALVTYKWRRRHLSMDDRIEEFLQSQNNLVPLRYSYKEIKKMTKSFKDKLGEGGYGSVFKGKLRSGHHVAVKLLGKSKGNGQDFINEVASIGRIHHANVAKLIGFCVEGSKQALVYDFMSNGSLDKIIFTEENKNTLGWKKMFDIVLGVAQGIHYLHQGCDMQILHFDIKPHNILLDENFNPKVSDFGLAKLYSVDDSIFSLTAARGTIGYIAPELVYKNLGGISYKADVYSFGMLLMEMVGRRKNVNAFADHTSQIYFPSWIYDRLDQGEDIELGDVSDDEKVMVKKMIITAF